LGQSTGAIYEANIHNNDFYNIPGTAINVGGSPVNVLNIKDNIFSGVRDYSVYNTAGITTSVSYNDLWNSGGITGATARNTYNFDPLFVNSTAGDFHLKPGSPALTASEERTEIGAYGGASGPSLTFNFSLSSSGNITVNRGGSGSNTITAGLVSGTTQPITFSVSGLPGGASNSFNPNSCSPTCQTTLAISTTGSTPAGAYPITVTGTSGALNKTTTLNLIVAAPASNIVYVATDVTGDYNCATSRTDCDVEINNALSHIHGLGGGTVHIKPGTYVISNTIVIYDNTTLEGDGWTSIIKLRDYAAWWTADKSLIENEKKNTGATGQNTNIVLKNFKVDANGDRQSEPRGAFYYNIIHFARARNIDILGLSIINNLNDQIKFGANSVSPADGVYDSIIDGNNMEDSGHSNVYLLGSNNITLKNNNIMVRANSGIRTWNSNNIYAINNTVYGGPLWSEFGFEIMTSGSGVTDNILIKDNIIRNTGLTPIWLTAAPSSRDAAKNVKIIGNQIYYGSRSWPYGSSGYEGGGIVIQNYDNTTIENNVIYNNKGSGIAFHSNAYPLYTPDS